MTTAQKEITPLGLIPVHQLALVKMDPDLIERLYKKLAQVDDEITLADVKVRMRNNCWVVDQYAQLCGKSVPTITNMTLQPVLNGEKIDVALDYCYPFPGNKLGPKFIVRNEKSMNYLLSCI